jgi:hypothetical protein
MDWERNLRNHLNGLGEAAGDLERDQHIDLKNPSEEEHACYANEAKKRRTSANSSSSAPCSSHSIIASGSQIPDELAIHPSLQVCTKHTFEVLKEK